MNLSEDLKKLMLAGIGAVATSAEKAKDVIDDLVKKGEITFEQGKVLNEELKRNISDTINKYAPGKNSECNCECEYTCESECKCEEESVETIIDKLDSLSEEEITKIKEKLAQMEQSDDKC